MSSTPLAGTAESKPLDEATKQALAVMAKFPLIARVVYMEQQLFNAPREGGIKSRLDELEKMMQPTAASATSPMSLPRRVVALEMLMLARNAASGAFGSDTTAAASVSGKPVVAASPSPSSSFLGRVAHMEEVLYGSSRGGSILGRLAALEKDMLQAVPGSTLPETVAPIAQRIAALEAQRLPRGN